jgi:hypothetical protein
LDIGLGQVVAAAVDKSQVLPPLLGVGSPRSGGAALVQDVFTSDNLTEVHLGLIGHSRRDGLVGLVEDISPLDEEDPIYRSPGEGLDIGIGKPIGLATGVVAPNDDNHGLQGVHAVTPGPSVIRAQDGTMCVELCPII